MTRLKNGEHMVDVDRLRPGVHIKLVGVPWYRHPFLTSSFRIKDFETIETLHSLGVEKVIVIPDKSLVTPLKVTKRSLFHAQSILNWLRLQMLCSKKRKPGWKS